MGAKIVSKKVWRPKAKTKNAGTKKWFGARHSGKGKNNDVIILVLFILLVIISTSSSAVRTRNIAKLSNMLSRMIIAK